MNPEPYAFAKRLLEPLDDYLRHNLHQLTCKDIRALYEGLFDSQKVYRGTCNRHYRLLRVPRAPTVSPLAGSGTERIHG
jgi:hypothetical protein